RPVPVGRLRPGTPPHPHRPVGGGGPVPAAATRRRFLPLPLRPGPTRRGSHRRATRRGPAPQGPGPPPPLAPHPAGEPAPPARRERLLHRPRRTRPHPP